MQTNKVIAIVVVAIVVAAAASIAFITLGKDSDDKPSKGSGRLLLYGNVDNDDYLDNDDLNKLNEILEDQANGTAWDEETYPFADVNNDGSVDQSDVTYLQNILDKEKTIVYYIGSSGQVCQFHYPATGRYIACSSDYGMMMTQVLGIYDLVKAGSSRTVTLDETRYPGCQSTITSLGTYASGSYETFVESFLESECSILLGQVTTSVYELILNSGKEADLILLSPSAEIQQNGIDVVSSILTCGVLLDAADAAREYTGYCDDITDYITENIKDEQTVTFVDAYNTNNAVTTTVHTTKGTNGSMTGVIWTLSFLPMTSDVPWNELDTNGRSLNVEIETIMDLDPDILIITAWGKVATDADPADAQKVYDEMAKYFSQTNAYKNGKVYAFSYEIYGTYLGVGGLALLASYIWPDSFSEEEGWDKLQEVIDRFTLMEVDVKEMGGIIPYKVNTDS